MGKVILILYVSNVVLFSKITGMGVKAFDTPVN